MYPQVLCDALVISCPSPQGMMEKIWCGLARFFVLMEEGLDLARLS